jgi:hypothetical protein
MEVKSVLLFLPRRTATPTCAHWIALYLLGTRSQPAQRLVVVAFNTEAVWSPKHEVTVEKLVLHFMEPENATPSLALLTV